MKIAMRTSLSFALLVVASGLVLPSSVFAGEQDAIRGEIHLGRGTGADEFWIHHPPDPVNVKNANFYLPFTDLSYPLPGFPLEIERAYNSRSLHDGPLGFGWTFNYDINVRVDDFGNVQIIEADGFESDFVPEGSKAGTAQEVAIDKYIAIRKANDEKNAALKDERYYRRLKQRLMEDPSLFQKMREQTPELGGNEPAEGRYISTSRGVQVLRVTKESYIRTFPNGLRHVFYKSGRLWKMVDPGGRSITLRYSKGARGDLTEVVHSDGQKLKFQLTPAGKIGRATDPKGRSVEYKYDDQNNLIAFKDTKGKITRFEYDEWHNMTKIVFPNGDTIENIYDVERDWIMEQKGPGTKKTVYKYGEDASNPAHYWTTVREGSDVSRYDYYDNEDKVVIVDPQGRKTEKVFSKCCGKPLRVKTPDGRLTKYKYDKRGNVTQITDSAGTKVSYEYHPKFNKVAKVVTPQGETVYSYDGQGQLVKGKSADGTEVSLRYAKNGRVAIISNGKGEKYEFKYNDAGKPVQIRPSGAKGAVVIDYADDGTVKGVRSIGKGVDYRDTLARLQRLMKVVEPAYRFEL